MASRMNKWRNKASWFNSLCYNVNSRMNKIINRLKNNKFFYGCYCLNEIEKQEIIKKREQARQEYIQKQEQEMSKSIWGQELLQYRLDKSNYYNISYNDNLTGNSYIVK